MSRNAPALLFLLLVAAGFSLWFFLKPDPFGDALQEREIATRGLAEHLARTQPGKRVLVVSNPFTKQPNTARAILEMEEAGLRGLREGFGKGIAGHTIAFPDLKPEARENPGALITDVETTTPLSYLVSSNAFDQLAKQHADCELIVSLIGLPLDIDSSDAWKSAPAPMFALLLPDLKILGDAAAVKGALKSGKLVAFVLSKPEAPTAQGTGGSDWKAEFEKRFLLVTPDNVEQLLQAYPSLF